MTDWNGFPTKRSTNLHPRVSQSLVDRRGGGGGHARGTAANRRSVAHLLYDENELLEVGDV